MLRAPLTLLFITVLATATSFAEENPALYQATAIVTGTDMRQRPLGFAECLSEVLVKVSGMPRLRDDAAVATLAGHADGFVASFSYVDPRAGRLHHDDQGTYDRSYEMTVQFDRGKIDAALAALGIAPWRGTRPLLEPLILVRPTNETPFYLSAETPRGADLRAAVVLSASQVGIGVHFPTEADLDAWGVVPFGFPAPLSEPVPARLQVTGSLTWDVHAKGWIGIWRARRNGAERDWRIIGVGFDTALADMVRGAVVLARGTAVP